VAVLPLLAASLACSTAQAQDNSPASTLGQTSIDYPWRPGQPASPARTGWSAPGTRDWASAVHASYGGGARLANYPSNGRVERVSAEAPVAGPSYEAEGDPGAAAPDGVYAEEDPAYYQHDPRFAPTVRGPYFGGACAGPGDCCGWPFGTCLGPLSGRLWVSADYLLWWMKGTEVPPLVTTSPAGTPRDRAGVLGLATTQILFGGRAIDNDADSGGRLNFGLWLDPCQTVGVEGDYLALGRATTRFNAASPAETILARPFLNVETGLQDSGVIVFPGVANPGQVSVLGSSVFQGAEVLLRRALYRNCNSRADVLIGYRFNQLDDKIEIAETSTSIDGGLVPVGTVLALNDLFRTTNQFNGAELGIAASWRECAWSLESVMKVALGDTHSRIVIDGSTTTTLPNGGGTTTAPGGLLALPTNIGTYEKDNFAMIPELGVTLSRDLTCRLRASVGYSLIYWSKVIRAGEQIDLNVNPSQFPPRALAGAPEPQFRAVTTDFWARGLNFGLDLRF
jgi:hypothetical protein